MNTTINSVSRCSASFGISLAVAGVANSLLVIAKEKSPAVMAAMKRLTGHHWITHSAFVIILFVTVGWLLSKINGSKGPDVTIKNLVTIVAGGAVLCSLLIMGFYLFAD